MDELFDELCGAIMWGIEDVDGVSHVSANCFGEFLIVLDDGSRYEFSFEPFEQEQ